MPASFGMLRDYTIGSIGSAVPFFPLFMGIMIIHNGNPCQPISIKGNLGSVSLTWETPVDLF